MLDKLLKYTTNDEVIKAIKYILSLNNENIESHIAELLPIEITGKIPYQYKETIEDILISCCNTLIIINKENTITTEELTSILTNYAPNCSLGEFAEYNNLSLEEVVNIYKLERSNGLPIVVKEELFKYSDYNVKDVLINKFNKNYYVYTLLIGNILTNYSEMAIQEFKLDKCVILKLYAKVIDIENDTLTEISRSLILEALLIDYVVVNCELGNNILRLAPKDYLNKFLETKVGFTEMIKLYR